LSINIQGRLGVLYDIDDEVNAYKEQRTLEFGVLMFTTPNAFVGDFPIRMNSDDIRQISKDFKRVEKGIYSDVPDNPLKLNTSNAIRLLKARNRQRMVEYYKGWQKQLKH
jgi:hypothetical protein